MRKLNFLLTVTITVLLLYISVDAQTVPTTLIEMYGKDGFTINNEVSDQPTSIGNWIQGANMPHARYYAGSVMYTRSDTSWLYVFGGDTTGSGDPTSTCLRYNLETDTWEYIAPLPEPIRVNAAAKLGDKLYSIGGFNAPFPSPSLKSFYEYDVNTNSWTQLPDFPDFIFFTGAEGFEDSLIYIFGGITDGGNNDDPSVGDLWLNNVRVYYRHTMQFEDADPMPEATASFGHARIGASFYLTGGLKSTTELWNVQMRGEVDPVIKTNITWTLRANYPLSIYAAYNYPIENNEEHCVLGGSTTTGFTPISEGFRHNIAQNNFMMKQPLPINLMASSGGHTKILERSPDGEIIQRVVLAGGITNGPALTNQTWIFTDTVNVAGLSEITNDVPENYLLSQNYPNPFNPSTTINFTIPVASFVSLKVFSSLGQEIETLVLKELNAGNYKYDWDAKNFTSGIYFYTIQTGNFIETKKMILLK